MQSDTHARLAVDIGGTFTDIAIESHGEIVTAKTPTTPAEPVLGVMAGVRLALERAGISPGAVASVIHGTTLATNALIERKGAAVGLVTTEGFRDVLEIAYERRYDQYDIFLDKPDTLVPRDRCFTIAERIGAGGEVLTPLDETAVEGLLERLDRAGVESVAVGLLHSYANDRHERRLRDLLLARRPDLPVTLSSEVSPEIREYDRFCTALANAYVMPMMARYLTALEGALRDAGFGCPLFMITSGGGMTTLETALRFPIRLVESGPSGGAILAARIARQCGIDEAVSFDMGGTTAKICLIDGGEPQTSRHFEIARAARFIKGSGLPVRIPVIEMIEIGAGGGSVASVDGLGRIAVGPESAGAEPGPACYGLGGERATVTDADALLGYLDPDAFAEGRLRLRIDRARAAVGGGVADPLGASPEAGADGISRMVDENMANAARIHAVERGKDLAARTMIAFGGNGPLHATRVADKVGVSRILVPPDPGVGSAVGFLGAPVSHEIVRSRHMLADRLDVAAADRLLESMESEARAIVRAGAPEAPVRTRRGAFMRYRGQGHEIEVALPDGPLGSGAVEDLRRRYEAAYAALYGRFVPEMEIEVMNWLVAVSTLPEPTAAPPGVAAENQPRPDAARAVTFGHDGRSEEVPCFARGGLAPGDRVAGPALIVEPQTTTWVGPGFDARVDGGLNLVLTRRGAARVERRAKGSRPSSIELQVMWNRLLAVVEEQAQALIRTAFSPIVRECGDISAGVFDPEGRMLAQAVTGTPGHINTMAAAVPNMLDAFPLETMRPGDVFMTNDPWLAAGHLNDVLLVAPVFRGRAPVALVSCTSHLYDLGGLGMGPDGSDVFDEGLLLPPLKLVEEGRVNDLVLSIVKANSRAPVSCEGDIYALIACCDVGADRLAEMMGEFGLERLDGLAAYILEASRAGAAEAIRRVPDGVYRNAMRIDGYESEIELKATLTVAGERMTVDFDGTSPGSRRGINVPINYTAAYAVFGLRCLVGPEIPNNAGSLAPFQVTAPEGSILNARRPAAVAMRHTIGHLASDLVLGCLHRAMPGRVPAESTSTMWDLPMRNGAAAGGNGTAGGNATAFAIELTHHGGMGARPASDGLSATAFPSGVWGSQVEVTESIVPVRVARRELRPDSGGAGRFRGGLGQIIELESSESAPIALFAAVERVIYPARGRAGGGDGARGRISLASGRILAGKGEQPIPAGDRLIFETPGGGGYGNPRERPPEQVADDVRLSLVSRAAAERDYAVVVDGEGRLDRPATERLRAGSPRTGRRAAE